MTFRLITAAFLWLACAMPAFAFKNYDIPSGAMVPTLFIGDLATAAFYGIDYEVLADGRSIEAARSADARFQPKLGDIAVFRSRTGEDSIMRIVAMPGDRIALADGRLFLNGVAVPTEDVASIPGACAEENSCRFSRETLPNGATYIVMQTADDAFSDAMPEVVLPPDRYFFLGDNRDNSFDSRYHERTDAPVGLVPREALLGRLQMVWPNADHAPGAERLAGYPGRR